MTDLQNISSNLLLVGFVLISICCLYLLYSNFSKIRDINDLKRNVEDLKTIFFNQQKHNDETYNNLINIIKSDDKISDKVLDINIETTKIINIDENIEKPILIKLTKENIDNIKNVENILSKNNEQKNNEQKTSEQKTSENKNINIELEDLDKLDEMKEISDISDCESDLNSDENLNTVDLNDNTLLNEKVIDDNIFDIIHSIKNNDQQDLFNDNNSITTDPIIDDLDETNFDIDDLNNLMDSDNEAEDQDQYLENAAFEKSRAKAAFEKSRAKTQDLENPERKAAFEKSRAKTQDLENPERKEDDDDDEDDEDQDLENPEFKDDDKQEENTGDDLDTLDLDNFDLDTIDVKKVVDPNIKIISVNQDTTETIELDDLLSGKEDIKTIKNINLNGNGNEKIEYNLENLNNMSIKQLKEIAKQYKAKTSGTKQDLIQSISKVLNL